MRTILKVIAVVFFIVASVIGTDIYLGIPLSFDGPTISISHIGLLAASFIGITMSIALQELRSQEGLPRVNFERLANGYLAPNALKAYIVSPIVFFTVLITYGSGTVGGSELLMALQNGFFWDTVFNKKSNTS